MEKTTRSKKFQQMMTLPPRAESTCSLKKKRYKRKGFWANKVRWGIARKQQSKTNRDGCKHYLFCGMLRGEIKSFSCPYSKQAQRKGERKKIPTVLFLFLSFLVGKVVVYFSFLDEKDIMMDNTCNNPQKIE